MARMQVFTGCADNDAWKLETETGGRPRRRASSHPPRDSAPKTRRGHAPGQQVQSHHVVLGRTGGNCRGRS
jgi:hypothetical protein